jgi:hypothetical protein
MPMSCSAVVKRKRKKEEGKGFWFSYRMLTTGNTGQTFSNPVIPVSPVVREAT